MHPYALDAIFTAYELRNLIKPRLKDDPFLQLVKKNLDFGPLMDAAVRHEDIPDGLEQLYAAVNRVRAQSDLIEKYNRNMSEAFQRNRFFVLSEFPRQYVQQLEQLLYPEWYVAAFSSRCDDPSMWGYYGDNHRGFCLVFKAHDGRGSPSLSFSAMNGWEENKNYSGPTYGRVTHPFEKIDYAEKYPEIDFFRSLGRLPTPALNENWYIDEAGSRSICFDHVRKDEAEWREKYWNTYGSLRTVKLKAWEHEQEYRLTLRDGAVLDFSDKSRRTIKYDFKDLDGIIFGINTLETDKLKVIEIIEQKCRLESRKNFTFYQAYYSLQNGNIGVSTLDLLKLN